MYFVQCYFFVIDILKRNYMLITLVNYKAYYSLVASVSPRTPTNYVAVVSIVCI